MREGTAFHFIPELLGDINRVIELSGNPKRLYIEAAIGTLHSAASVFACVQDHINTKHKEEISQILNENYKDLDEKKNMNHIEEELCKIDIAYESVKLKIQNGQFRDVTVKQFINKIKDELHRVYGIFKIIQADSDYSDKSKIEEVARKTLRDYNKIITVCIEEEKIDG